MEDVGVYTAVCGEDEMWVDQYLKEIERLGFPFAIHLDRCGAEMKRKLVNHPLCVGSTKAPDREFEEWDKQGVMDILMHHGFKRGLAWDIDETWEEEAPAKIRAMANSEPDYFRLKWVNLWDDRDHIRVDGHFKHGFRVNLYRLSLNWRFDHKITNGPKAKEPLILERADLTCIHWGMMTHELRMMHKERWDRIYTKAVGNNPYGFWASALDYENYPPVTEPYDHRAFG